MDQNNPSTVSNQQAGASTPAARILLVRHGETALNEEKRIRGWLDVDLSDKGRADSNKTGAVLQQHQPSEILTSDLTRAEQTGQILQQHLQVPMDNSRDLRPWDLGKFTGLKFDDIHDEMNRYIANPKKAVPGGESFNDFLERWRGGLQDLAGRAMQSPTGTVAAVTHSRNIEATRYMLSGEKDVNSLATANTVPPSGVMQLSIQNGKVSEAPFDNSHLTKDE